MPPVHTTGPTPRAARHHRAEPPISLREIVAALCSALPPSAEGLELILDRIEKTT
ncbi:hypothetical protein [Paenirhodobacter sp. CAU 1674]|jgi:hypothetical protein|uniref:hypothetical protein n=1 Tax=Paenirhodobacter sp. CAU 1674 TaxID=3032596 RepID=UPI0023DC82E7|nr:hypothetical protein [Paenirhodobacter sp. CAU 1674]MDF2142228.1 hypothetical protein [Paenirhodobacter sp. CAU 1674]